MANKRGDLRKRPDPIAIATKGRQTTYEFETQNVAGVPTKLKTANKPVKLITNVAKGETFTTTFILNSIDYPSKNDLEFDIGTGVLTNGG